MGQGYAEFGSLDKRARRYIPKFWAEQDLGGSWSVIRDESGNPVPFTGDQRAIYLVNTYQDPVYAPTPVDNIYFYTEEEALAVSSQIMVVTWMNETSPTMGLRNYGAFGVGYCRYQTNDWPTNSGNISTIEQTFSLDNHTFGYNGFPYAITWSATEQIRGAIRFYK